MKRTILTLIIVCLAVSMFAGCNGRGEADFNGAISPIACETADEAARLFLEEEYSNEYETLEFVSYSKTADLGKKEIEALDLGEYSAADVKSGERGEVTYREVTANSTAAVATKDNATLGKEVYILSMADGLHYYTPAVKVGEKVPYSMMVKLYNASTSSEEFSSQVSFTEGDQVIAASLKRSGDRAEIISTADGAEVTVIMFKAGDECYVAYKYDGEWDYIEDELEYAYYLVSTGAKIENLDVSDEVKEELKDMVGEDISIGDSNIDSYVADMYGSFIYKSKNTIALNYSLAGNTITAEYKISDGRITKLKLEVNGSYAQVSGEASYSYKNIKIDLPDELKALLKEDGINV